MKKKIILSVMSLMLILSLSSCSDHKQDNFSGVQNVTSEDVYSVEGNVEQSSQILDDYNGISDAEEKKDAGYSILAYTEAPNKNSSVSIQYPFFEGEGNEILNNLILAKVQEFARIDDSLFPADAGLTIDYQVEITLQNAKIVSMVFWGTSAIGVDAYRTSDVIPFNIDIQTMEEVSFEDLYAADDDFQKVFFEKAYFPTNPVTSCDEGSFAEMLQLQSPEYQPISPFSIPGNVSCFLKPDALVLVMPAVHAAGSDYFEAQINYEDIEAFLKDETASIGGIQQNIEPVEKNMLLYGECGGNLGLGWLLYTVPKQEGQDYKIYFFSDRNSDDSMGYKSFEEIDFNLEQADFVFPDTRENNIAIGKYIEMYLYETFTTESGKSNSIVIATYEIDGKQYYDTRIYTPDEGGYGYVVDESMTAELNALYADVEEYPVLQIIEMPHD